MKKLFWFILSLVLLVSCNYALATGSDNLLQHSRPFKVASHGPIQNLLAIPTASSSFLLPEDQFFFDIQVDVANNFTHSQEGQESVWFDGENTVIKLGFLKGLGTNWQIGIEFPWIYMGGGSTDRIIQDWHSFWGLPDGNREFVENDQLKYYYENKADRGVKVDLHQSNSGIGDMRIRVSRSLFRGFGRAFSFQSQLKLPTGDSDFLRGSGSTDLALGLAFADANSGKDFRLNYFVNGGLQWLGRGEILDTIRREVVAYANTGITWKALENTYVKLQVDSHTAGYESQLSELGESVRLVIGGSVRLFGQWILNLAISEDLRVGSTSDVTFTINLGFLSSE